MLTAIFPLILLGLGILAVLMLLAFIPVGLWISA